MASAELTRRVEKVVTYPPLCEMGDLQRREFHEALLEADGFEDLPPAGTASKCRQVDLLNFSSRARAREQQIRAHYTVQVARSHGRGPDHFRHSAAHVDSWRPHSSQGQARALGEPPPQGRRYRLRAHSTRGCR